MQSKCSYQHRYRNLGLDITCHNHISHITYASIIQYHISHHILQTYKVMSHDVMLNYILSSDQNVRYDMTLRYQMRRWHKCKITVPHLPSSAKVKKSEWKKVHTNKLWKENLFYGVCIFWIPSIESLSTSTYLFDRNLTYVKKFSEHPQKIIFKNIMSLLTFH